MNKIPWGKDRLSGRMVHVDKVPNGKACGAICPACFQHLIAKQGTVRVPHFAHQGNAAGCDRWTHDTAVELLFQRINDALTEGDDLSMKWKCEQCRCVHSGNLLKKVDFCKKEQPLNGGRIRPDLVLYESGQVKTLIEVVDTHAPEPAVCEYAESNGPLLVINVTHGLDPAPVMQASPLEPDQVLYVQGCPCGWCQHCNKVRNCEEYHRYCNKCEECVRDVDDHGGYGSHGHCKECGKAIEGRENTYGHHYCCYVRRRYGLGACPDREHHHCKTCGKLTGRGMYGFYEECYSCNQQASKQQGQERESRALALDAKWYEVNPDWPKPTF